MMAAKDDQVPALNEGRGLNPGETAVRQPPAVPLLSLNEGRGLNPGENALPAAGTYPTYQRSTKAGA